MAQTDCTCGQGPMKPTCVVCAERNFMTADWVLSGEEANAYRRIVDGDGDA